MDSAVKGSSPERTILFLMLIVVFCCPNNAAGADPSKFSKEEQSKIIEYFLHKVVIAKIAMPMTTEGVLTRWIPKDQEWLVYNNQYDMREWGVGVNIGEKYQITEVKFEKDRIELWLNDGGMISALDRWNEGWKWAGGQLNQIKQNQEMQQKRSSANGSRVKIYLQQLPPGEAPMLEILMSQAATFFDMAGGLASQSEQAELKGGVVHLSSEPESGEVWVDDSFVGNTPATLRLLPGNHKIRVSLAGYIDWEREIDVLAESEVSLPATLKKVGI